MKRASFFQKINGPIKTVTNKIFCYKNNFLSYFLRELFGIETILSRITRLILIFMVLIFYSNCKEDEISETIIKSPVYYDITIENNDIKSLVKTIDGKVQEKIIHEDNDSIFNRYRYIRIDSLFLYEMDEFRIGDDHLARSGKGFYFNGHDSIYHDIELKYNCGFLTFLKYYYLGEQSGWIYYSYETDSENVLSRDYENNSADWSLYYFSYNNIKNLIDIMTFRPKVLGKISTNLVSEMERFDKSTQYETDKPTVTTFDYTLNDDGYVVEMKYEELDYNGIYKRNYILTKQTIYFNYEFL